MPSSVQPTASSAATASKRLKRPRKNDVWDRDFVGEKYEKESEVYGVPKFEKTRQRAEKAGTKPSIRSPLFMIRASARHIAREQVYLCEIILEYTEARVEATGHTVITFGELFRIYQYISDKVVGMLLRARKNKMLDFEGEMLFQRRDEAVVITLLLSPAEVKEAAAKGQLFATRGKRTGRVSSVRDDENLPAALLAAVCLPSAVSAIELTFELPDNANQCFYEDITTAGTRSILEFQVVTGGQYDVDCVLEDPHGKIIYKEARKQYDSHEFKADVPGTYKVCFSNEFSTFSHKIVYMDWQIGDEINGGQRPDGHGGAPTPRLAAATQLESSAQTIGDRLRTTKRTTACGEATGRRRAEDLNERVLIWSIGQTAVIVLASIGQVLLLKSFFNQKPSRI
ncbi:GOLD domain-containing protein [Aphelenchoides fujianensis]|nr:GOLD domain-containing protein [Aphelenchoides fujianensis]